MDKSDLVKVVKAHAVAHYADGWDVVVECYTDEEIVEVIGKTRTLKGAVAKFADILDVYADREADARNSAF